MLCRPVSTAFTRAATVHLGHLMLTQARILARHLRGDIPQYLPCVLK